MSLLDPQLHHALKKTITIRPQSGVIEARDVLSRFNISRVVVTNLKNNPVGIVTEKDLIRAIFGLGAKKMGSLRVQDIMSKNLIAARTRDSIYDCAKLMKKNGISSVIVLNPDDTLAGLLTKTDIVNVFLIQATTQLKVSHVMTPKVITVSPDDSLYLVESVLINNKISRVIVAKNKKPVGVITYRDFVPTKISHPARELTEPEELSEIQWVPRPNQFNVKNLDHALTFRAMDIMTPNPLTVESNELLTVAAWIMIRHHISGIPVLKRSQLAGIITKADIVNVVAEHS